LPFIYGVYSHRAESISLPAGMRWKPKGKSKVQSVQNSDASERDRVTKAERDRDRARERDGGGLKWMPVQLEALVGSEISKPACNPGA